MSSSATGSFEVALDTSHLEPTPPIQGLVSGERRVVVTLPDQTRLMADTNGSFVHVSPLTTEASLVRQRRPGTTEAAAESAVKTFFAIPQQLALEDVGGDDTPFSEARFQVDATAYNASHQQPGSTSEQPLLEADAPKVASELGVGAGGPLQGGAAPPEPEQLALPGAASLGINADNTDPEGSLDPDQQINLANDAGVDRSLLSVKDLELGFNWGLANTIANTAGSIADGVLRTLLLRIVANQFVNAPGGTILSTSS